MRRDEVDLRLHGASRRVVQDPPLVLSLFGETRFAWLWLVARVYLGWELLSAGRRKLQDPAWVDGGTALQTNWRDAASDSHNNGWTAWNHDLLQFLIDHEWHGWMALVIAVGETLIGIGLILGLTTGLAAFGGEVMAGSAVLAGGATVNPLLFAIATLLVLAWKTGGWIGLDRWVLPLLDRPQSGIRAPVRADPVIETAKPVNVTR